VIWVAFAVFVGLVGCFVYEAISVADAVRHYDDEAWS
jgi:hypothetical protein